MRGGGGDNLWELDDLPKHSSSFGPELSVDPSRRWGEYGKMIAVILNRYPVYGDWRGFVAIALALLDHGIRIFRFNGHIALKLGSKNIIET